MARQKQSTNYLNFTAIEDVNNCIANFFNNTLSYIAKIEVVKSKSFHLNLLSISYLKQNIPH